MSLLSKLFNRNFEKPLLAVFVAREARNRTEYHMTMHCCPIAIRARCNGLHSIKDKLKRDEYIRSEFDCRIIRHTTASRFSTSFYFQPNSSRPYKLYRMAASSRSRATPGRFVFLPNEESAPESDLGAEDNATLQSAIEAKDSGNKLFLGRLYDDAVAKYTEGISLLNGTDDKLCLQELAICYQERATAYEKLKMFDNALVDATTAIDLNEMYSRAYFRRCNIFREQQKFYCALQDIIQACILENFSIKAYNKLVAELNTQISKCFFSYVTNNSDR